MSSAEKVLIVAFTLLFIASTVLLLRRFYRENTEVVPVRGGTYIEGSVGTIRMLNPWFTVTNDVNRDIVSLVFAGLQRYNPFTGEVEDDMASITLSNGNRIYTATLRENLHWHDSTPEDPHPVTADDVLFTYAAIKQQGFPNPILQKNFRGIELEKIDDRTVQFRLEKPYAFFRSNLTLGILPARSFENVPAERLPDALDFNLSPIGSGPYRFKSISENELSTEVTLELFREFYGAKPFIERIVFRAFPDYPSLLSDLRNLHGVRHVARNPQGKAIIPDRYRTFYYTLPQYVALFFNLDQEVLQDQKLRLGLQLATDKQAIINAINEQLIIDTPLLEFAQENWQYQFQPDAAQGALFDSQWRLPERVRLQHLLELRDRNLTGALVLPEPIVLLETGAFLTFTGTAASAHVPLSVNGVSAHSDPDAGSGAWSVTLQSDGGTGSLAIGENTLRLTGSGGVHLDTFVLTRTADRSTFLRLREEQKIVELYESEGGERKGIETLALEHGMLRLRKDDEPQGIRVNDRGEPLHLTLLTSPLPPSYKTVAEETKREWRAVGADVDVQVSSDRKTFEDRVIRRDYDVLLFGQPLLDNLDSYPYWHSSQIQVKGGADAEKPLKLDANNLSQFTHFKADAFLEQIRETSVPEERKKALAALREVFLQEIPAIVLYSPTYVFAVSEEIFGIDLGEPSLHSDRFLSLHRWFIKEGRDFKIGKSWLSFFSWLPTLWEEPSEVVTH